MATKSNKVSTWQCTSKCKLIEHGRKINEAIATKSLISIQSSWHSCANADHQHDALGRTPLHMAASYGRYDLVRWLIKDRKLDVNARDDESGWTPLHRCLFYGHLDVAALLVKLGADLFAEDREGLTPLDMVLIDRKQTFPSLHLSPPAHVFTWGLNDNFTLGHAESNCRLPGRVKFITASQAAKTISIKQIVMCQFHSVFLSHDGRVFTCGHGQGGRLGIADEETTLRASEISSITGIKIAQIAAARDHTVLLTDKGAVYTFGMNNYHQLGQVPSPKRCLKPKQISSKHLHNKVMIGIAAGTYHTVMHTNEELYTCGTNYGQIGHAAMEKQVTLPKLVSSLSLESSTELVKRKIQIVAASEYATACTTDVGEIYIMSDFNIRKIRIPRGQQSIERLRLKSFAIPSNNSNSNEHRIMLFVICKPNFQLLSWTNEYRKLYICKWAQKPDMHIMDIAFTEDNKVLISAENGKCYRGKIKKKAFKESTKLSSAMPSSLSLTEICIRLNSEVIHYLDLKRVPLVHHAKQVAMDDKGSNFAVLQWDAYQGMNNRASKSESKLNADMAKLLQTASLNDHIHDIIIKVDGLVIPCHRFVLCSRSIAFAEILGKGAVDEATMGIYQIDDMSYDVAINLLQFIYTRDCILLQRNTAYSRQEMQDLETSNSKLPLTDIELSRKKMEHEQASTTANYEKTKYGYIPVNVKELRRAAKHYKIPGLRESIDALYYREQFSDDLNTANIGKLCFNHDTIQESSDFTLESNDGETFCCHKCMFIHRSEYFFSMLSCSWKESKAGLVRLKLMIPSDLLKCIVEYIYNDNTEVFTESNDAEFLSNIVVAADYLLLSDLKQICEWRLSKLITLKTVITFTDFSLTYNAKLLNDACIEFICINLGYLLEGRIFDNVTLSVLENVSDMYKTKITGILSRTVSFQSSHIDYTSASNDGASFVTLESNSNVEPLKDDLPKSTVAAKSLHTSTPTKDIHKTLPSSSGACSKIDDNTHSSASVEDSIMSDILAYDLSDILDTSDTLLLPAINQQTTNEEASFTTTISKNNENTNSNSVSQSNKRKKKRSQKMRKAELLKVGTAATVTAEPPKNTPPLSKSQPTVNTNASSRVKKWNSSQSANSNSLLSIMAEEEEVARKQQDSLHPTKPNSYQSANNTTYNEAIKWGVAQDVKKKSNRQRNISTSSNISLSSNETEMLASSSSKCPWGNVKQSASFSLGDVMKQEEVARLDGRGSNNRKVQSSSSSSKTMPSKGTSRFLDIVSSQAEENYISFRRGKKSLSSIQLEEKAMSELLHEYGGRYNPEEYIIVEYERPEVSLNPSWFRK